ncbi:MAG: glycosyltransferase family 2 protein [Gallionella sp.]
MFITSGDAERVSVVMPSLNQAGYIERAIRSVLTQHDESVELIVMDGGSTDGTQSLLGRLAREAEGRLHWVSEADRGPAHAVNKAMAVAQGGVIGWLNADDAYSPGAVARAVQALQANPQWMMVYGHGQHIDEYDRVIDSYPTRRPDVPIQVFADGCFICQPTVFLRKTALPELGQLDENLKTAFDFEWWLRLFSCHPGRVGFVDAVQAHSRLHGASITLGQRETVIRESMQIVTRYLGVCPLHWFKSYVYEMLIKHPQPPWSDAQKTHLQEFAHSISACLSADDQRDIGVWLDHELTKAQYAQHTTSEERTRLGKLTATIRAIVNVYFWPDRKYTQTRKQIKLIKSSRLFDEEWYLSRYRDVARVGADPVEHYLQYGAAEGRNPSRLFNTRLYVESNPEITKMGMNPLVHFLTYGKADADRIEH